MKYILAILFTIIIILNLREPFISATTVGEGDYSDVMSVINHGNSTCRVYGNDFDFTVNVYYVTGEDYLGLWDGGDIYLNVNGGLDIDTVAHEAWHAVDTMLIRFPIKDRHYGAYIQGHLTRCVWWLVEEDLIEAGKLKVYRFN